MKINIIFDTQSIGVQLFWSLYQAMKNVPEIDVTKKGFFVTNKDAFKTFLKVHLLILVQSLTKASGNFMN